MPILKLRGLQLTLIFFLYLQFSLTSAIFRGKQVIICNCFKPFMCQSVFISYIFVKAIHGAISS
uniref:Uncharacterized protein n=1 Tax=Rhizophora mucronata TaxID=61149 RepID=A0A2P2QH00_RHIMU